MQDNSPAKWRQEDEQVRQEANGSLVPNRGKVESVSAIQRGFERVQQQVTNVREGRLRSLTLSLPLVWVARCHNTHPPRNRDTPILFVSLQNCEINWRNNQSGVRRSVSRYGFACIRRWGFPLNNTVAALTHRSNEEQGPVRYLIYSMFSPDYLHSLSLLCCIC